MLALPQTYMNASGEAVRALCEKNGIGPDEICVVFDDIDLPLGALRMRAKGSAGGQKGMKSTIIHFGTDEFARLRVGVRGEHYSRERELGDYVLEPFGREERRAVRRTEIAQHLEIGLLHPDGQEHEVLFLLADPDQAGTEHRVRRERARPRRSGSGSKTGSTPR